MISLWRGSRGEQWVLVQFLLVGGYFFLPARELPVVTAAGSLRIDLAAAFGLGGLAFLLLGFKALGRSLTLLPRPKESGTLVRSSVYRVVRHPIYLGVILLALAWALFRWSGPHLAATLLLFFFFDAKSRREEAWLSAKYPEYAAYANRVKKLIPFVY